MIWLMVKRLLSKLCTVAAFVGAIAAGVQSEANRHFTFVLEDKMAHGDYAHIEKALRENRDSVLAALGMDDMPMVTVRLWRDNEHYQDVMEAAFGARAPGSRGYVVGDHEVRILLTGAENEPREAVHEFVHAVTLRLNPDFGNNPRWLWEAVAIYVAGETPRPETVFLFQNNKCPSLGQLSQPFNNGGSIYDVGYYLIDYTVNTWGNDTVIRLIKTNGDISGTLGISEDAFEKDWCSFVRSNYKQ